MRGVLGVAVVGAGRMGRRHAENLAANPDCRVRWIVDPADSARQLAASLQAQWAPDLSTALAAGDALAVVIATPTTLHAAAIRAALGAERAVFCEKPLLVDLEASAQLAREIRDSGLYFQMGFMRRYDPAYAEAHRAVRAGELGRLRQVLAISRDPSPPPASYLATSGGIFLDLGIHDIDLVRWLSGEEVTRATALGNVGDTAYIGDLGDAEEAAALLELSGGCLAAVLGSRTSRYGYDIRTELWGTGGSLVAGYLRAPAVTRLGPEGIAAATVSGFLERFAQAYELEMDDFVRRVREGLPPPATAEDAVAGARVAEACLRSLRSGGPEAVV